MTRRTSRSSPRYISSERGAMLAFLLMVVGILSVLATGLAVLVRVDTVRQAVSEQSIRNLYGAEAGVDRGIAEFRNIFLNFTVPTASDLTPRSFDLGGQSITYQLTDVPGNPLNVTLPPGDVFAGLNSIQYRYTVTSDAMGRSGNRETRLGAEFDVNNVPLFQFASFYAEDLEILPGPTMQLHGRVHTNGNLYLNAGNTLTIAPNPPSVPSAQVSTTRDLFRGRKDASSCDGTVRIARQDGVLRNLVCNGGQPLSAADAAAWGGSVLVGVKNINPPQPGIIAKGQGNLFWDRADLRIVLNLTAGRTAQLLPGNPLSPLLYPIEIQNVDGTQDLTKTALLKTFMLAYGGKVFYSDVPNCSTSSPSTSCAGDRTKYTPNFATTGTVYRRADDAALDLNWRTVTGRLDYRRGGFFNNREKAPSHPAGNWTFLLNFDLQALLDWNRAQLPASRFLDPNDTTDGGIVIFASVQGPVSGSISNYGVRVFDSSDLGFPTPPPADPTGATLVSDQAMYVEGDFNRLDKAPAALIGDSLNVLSQNWEAASGSVRNDQKSALPLGSRNASNTTVNAGLLAGVDQTSPGDYNGGLENYPRFHEEWTGDTFTYLGSFVSLGQPLHVNGPWCGTGSGCNIYNPPIRNWDYDAAFNDAAWLPPLSPRVVFVQQTLFSQEYR